MAVANPQPVMPLALAAFIIFFTLVPAAGYVLMYIWFYLLNSRFRKRSESIRGELSKEATLSETKNRAIFVGFFHPYWSHYTSRKLTCSNAGGGGERVLWTAIRTIQLGFPEVISVVYSGDTDVTPEKILKNVKVESIEAVLI
jgi:alpha-1,2-mannosyltransferase